MLNHLHFFIFFMLFIFYPTMYGMNNPKILTFASQKTNLISKFESIITDGTLEDFTANRHFLNNLNQEDLYKLLARNDMRKQALLIVYSKSRSPQIFTDIQEIKEKHTCIKKTSSADAEHYLSNEVTKLTIIQQEIDEIFPN